MLERIIAGPGACGGTFPIILGIKLSEEKEKMWLPIDQEYQQSTDSQQKRLGEC
jgi:hypothetical protein